MIDGLPPAMPIVLAEAGWVIALVLASLLWQRRRARVRASAYMRNSSLLTPAERQFLRVLEQAVPPDFHIFAKLPLSRLVGLNRVKGSGKRQATRAAIQPYTVDFVLCDAGSLEVLCVILCDNGASPKRRGTMVRQVCEVIGLPLLHVRIGVRQDLDELKGAIKKAMDTAKAPTLPSRDESARPTHNKLGRSTRTQSANQKNMALGMHR